MDLTDGTSSTLLTFRSQRNKSSWRCENTERGRCIRTSRVQVCRVITVSFIRGLRTQVSALTILSRQGNHFADGSSESSFLTLRGLLRGRSETPALSSSARKLHDTLSKHQQGHSPGTIGSGTSSSSTADRSSSPSADPTEISSSRSNTDCATSAMPCCSNDKAKSVSSFA